MVQLSESSLLLVVGLLVCAMVGLTAIGGAAFFPIVAVLAISIPVVFYLTETGSETDSAVRTDQDELEGEEPVDLLRREFASGRIDQGEFEQRLEVLLETEPDSERNAERDLLRER